MTMEGAAAVAGVSARSAKRRSPALLARPLERRSRNPSLGDDDDSRRPSVSRRQWLLRLLPSLRGRNRVLSALLALWLVVPGSSLLPFFLLYRVLGLGSGSSSSGSSDGSSFHLPIPTAFLQQLMPPPPQQQQQQQHFERRSSVFAEGRDVTLELGGGPHHDARRIEVGEEACRRQCHWQFSPSNATSQPFRRLGSREGGEEGDGPVVEIPVLGPGRPACDLAIFTAGLPRAGSRLQHNLVLEAVRALQEEDDAGDAAAGPLAVYMSDGLLRWQLKHGEVDQPQPLKLDGGKRERVVLILKGHTYDARAHELCDRQLFFTVRRRVPDQALSFYRLGWVKDLRQLCGKLDFFLQHHGCVVRAGAVDWRFEELVRDKWAHAVAALRAIGGALGVGEERLKWVAEESEGLREGVRRWEEEDAHAGGAAGGSGGDAGGGDAGGGGGGLMLATSRGKGSGPELPEDWREVIRTRWAEVGL